MGCGRCLVPTVSSPHVGAAGDQRGSASAHDAGGRYADGSVSPDGQPHAIGKGEQSILAQYEQAIEAARSTIYIENQALPVPAIARRLEAALRRGVQVVFLLPAEPEQWVRQTRRDPARSALFEAVEALDQHDTFLLAGLMVPGEGRGQSVYVHAKVMLVDDAWMTIGSCNLHANSLGGHTELNASVWDASVVRALRCELLAEHLGQDTSGLDDRAALRLYRDVADANRNGAAASDVERHGLAVTLKATEYGR